MTTYRLIFAIFTALAALSGTALAASDFESPQYSGVGARTDGGMQSPAPPHIIRNGPINNPRYLHDHLYDTPGEKFIDRRNEHIRQEMQRRRDEVYRRIKTNE